jgi:hypothetical protein
MDPRRAAKEAAAAAAAAAAVAAEKAKTEAASSSLSSPSSSSSSSSSSSIANSSTTAQGEGADANDDGNLMSLYGDIAISDDATIGLGTDVPVTDMTGGDHAQTQQLPDQHHQQQQQQQQQQQVPQWGQWVNGCSLR